MDNVKDIERLREPRSFCSLELHEGQNTLIEKLFLNHANGTKKDPSMTDVMQGKYNELVILLHGMNISGACSTVTFLIFYRVSAKFEPLLLSKFSLPWLRN